MNINSPPEITPDASLARLLSVLSVVLLVVYLAAVLTTVLPPRPFDHQWQLQLVEVLVNNASLASLGAMLLALAVWFDRNNHSLLARWKAFERWALAACIGFLLLIPLQCYAGWRLYSTVTSYQQQRISDSSRQLADLRQAISSASTHQELQADVQKLIGKNAGLSPFDLSIPMPELRKKLLARTEQAANRLEQRVEAQAAIEPDKPLKQTIRIVVSAVAYAIGFAFIAGVLPRVPAESLVTRRGVDQDYFKSLSK